MAASLGSSVIEFIRHFRNSLTIFALPMSPLSTGAATRLACDRDCESKATSPSISGLTKFGSRSLAPSQGNASGPFFFPLSSLPAHSLNRHSLACSALSIQNERSAFAESNSFLALNIAAEVSVVSHCVYARAFSGAPARRAADALSIGTGTRASLR